MASRRQPGGRSGGRPDGLALQRRDELREEWRPFLIAAQNAFNARRNAMQTIDGAIAAVNGARSAVPTAPVGPVLDHLAAEHSRERRAVFEPREDGSGLAMMFADLYPDKSWDDVEPLFLETLAGAGTPGAVDPHVIVGAKVEPGMFTERLIASGVKAFKKRRERLAKKLTTRR